MSTARREQRGLTMIEVLIVVTVIVLATGIGITGVSRLSSVRLRTETNKLAAAVRYTFNRAAAHGLYMRMVFDLDSEAYWVEASATPQFLPREKLEEGEDETAKLEEEEGAREKTRAPHSQPTGTSKHAGKPATQREKYQEDKVIPRTQFKGGVGIEGVLTNGQQDVFETGKAYLHFLPNGWVEPAIIYTTDGKDAHYTLFVHPFTGKVTRKSGHVDPPPEFGEPDKVEEEGT